MAENADGSVIIPVDMNISKADKKLLQLAKKINDFERDIQSYKDKQLPLQKKLEELTLAADEAAKRLDKMQNAPIGTYTKEQIAEQGKTVRALGERWDAVQREVTGYSKKIEDITAKLNAAKEEYGELVIRQQQAEAEHQPVATDKTQQIVAKMGEAFKKAGSGISAVIKGATSSLKTLSSGILTATKKLNVFSTLSERLSGIMKKLGRTIKSALVFSVIYKGLSLVKEQVASYLTVNDEFSAALGRIKGALLTAFQPVYDVVVPALTTMLNVLTNVISSISQFTAALFGTTAKQAQNNAKALYEQADATEEASDAANEASKSLASFDEINKLSTNSTNSTEESSAVPTFDLNLDETQFSSWGEALDSFLDKILNEGIPNLESAFQKLGNVANTFSQNLLAMFSFPGLREKFAQLGESIAESLNSLFFSIEWNKFGQALGSGLDSALLLGASFLSSFDWLRLGSDLAGYVNGIVSQIDWYNLGMLLFSGFSIAIETLSGFLIGLDMSEIGGAASNLAVGFFDSITETLAGIDWEEIGHQVKEFLVNIDWGGVATSVFTAIGGAFAALTAFLWGLIQDAWKEVVNWWHDVAYEDGEFTLQGLLDGIWNVIKNIGTWIKEHIFQPFIDGFKKVFGIHSPSTVMKEQGNFIMEGLLNGIMEKVGSVIAGAKEVFNGIIDFVKNVFTGDWDSAWDSIASGFTNVWNGIISTLESAVNLIIKGINYLINQLNKVSFDIPDWVPAIGGKSFGFSIKNIGSISIPRLATGGVVPPNREFLALLGDNKTETEVVSPLSTMKQAMLEALRESGGGTGETVVVLELDGREFGRAVYKANKQESSRIGVSLVGV